MTTQSIADPEMSAPSESLPGQSKNREVSPVAFIETWLNRHTDAVALVVLAAALGVRIFTAAATYLNPDEALHYYLINQQSLWLAYKASLTNAHPPLIYTIVYFWRFLGASELMLRLPSVITGTAFCWALYRWMSFVFDKAAAVIGLVLAAFSPALIAVSAELRSYAVLLFGVGFALYFLARALEDKSVAKMLAFTGFLYIAILSHYSAAFFALALGIYALARIVDERPPSRVIVAWASGQACALAIYVTLYITHISKIRNSLALWSTTFGLAYFQPGSNIFAFTGDNTFNIFLFLFGRRSIAQIMLLLFIVGIAILFGRDLVLRNANSRSSRFGLLFLIPFASVWGAAIAGVYPYVGSRHTVFLAPFAIAGASYVLAAISGRKLWAGLLLAGLLITLSNVSYKPVEEDTSVGDHSPAVMAAAVNYMKQAIPRGDAILVDIQSSAPFIYYYCGPKVIVPMETFDRQNIEFACNGTPVISFHSWKLMPETFPIQFRKVAIASGLKAGDHVWIYQTGWLPNLNEKLNRQDPMFRCLDPKDFGAGVTVIPFVVSPDLSPATPSQSCADPEK